MALGMWADVPARFPLAFLLLHALWQQTPTRACPPPPPGPLHPPPAPLFVHLCFLTPRGVVLVAVTAPSLMGVPFGVVPRLSGLTRVIMSE